MRIVLGLILVSIGTLLSAPIPTAAEITSPSKTNTFKSSFYETSVLTRVSARGSFLFASVDSTETTGIAAEPYEYAFAYGIARDWAFVQTKDGWGYVPLSALDTFDTSQLPEIPSDLPAPPLPDAVSVIDTDVYPILPTITDYTHTIYERGLALGNRPDVFSKVGDCMSAEHHLFLGIFGAERARYDLGQHGDLADVIQFYSRTSPREGEPNSFAANSLATANGYTVASVIDPLWLMSGMCPDGTSPLMCEYRLSRPSVAVIMFGSNDIAALEPKHFDFFLRVVVHQTIEQGIIPLLSTFPGSTRSEERTHQFNQIIVQVARDYDVPMMNLWAALQPLPGVGRDGSVYLSKYSYESVGNFTEDGLQYGYNMRNLLVLRSLDMLWREVIR
jgi:hypothetical protein